MENIATSPLQFFTTSTDLTIDSLNTCDQQQEYFLISVEGQDLPYFSTFDSDGIVHQCPNFIGIEHGLCFFTMCMQKEYPGYFPNTPCVLGLSSLAVQDTFVSTNTIDLKILKFEAPGGIIKASFSGEFQLSPQMYGPSPALPFKGEFVMKRK